MLSFGTTFPSMEVTVTTAGSASEPITSAIITSWHELTATVIGMATNGSSVVPHAFFVLDNVFARVFSSFGVGDHGGDRFGVEYYVDILVMDSFRFVVVLLLVGYNTQVHFGKREREL